MVSGTIRFTLLIIMLTAALAGVAAGCNNGNHVNIGDNNMTTESRIPPIDTIKPAKVETATFAMG
jgi:hypothetical protein